MTGIICAMNLEVEGVLNLMTNTEEKTIDGVTFYKGFLGKSEVVAVECGIGKVNAAICTRMMIDFYNPDCIINSGVAGALSTQVSVGDIVIATSAVQHDYDTTAFGDPKGLITCPEGNVINFPADEELSQKLFEAAEELSDTRVFRGVIATGDEFVHSPERRLALGKAFSALACEMEGGAIAQVCYRAKKPYCILRSISDDLTNNTSMSFDEFKIMAAEKTVKVLSAVLK
ncbi:MAG: 5'-methylthioadenosine/adenosylhomocysteine nucleosidase [Ruminococcaceae bacterium]|nr:5'-methylthioadenosine/adenosylhomocysteine nucleosidase [Oscillospiraceae bacterium]